MCIRDSINYLGSSTDLSNWLHINSIDYNHEYNQILISSRNFNELYVIDHSTSISEAKTDSGGRSDKGGDLLFRFGNPEAFGEPELYDQVLFGQHDAQWISTNSVLNNAFSLFNNEYIPFLSSQLLIVNNPIHEGGTYTPEVLQDVNDSLIIYEYTSENFYSKILSGLTILPNGNKLVTEGFTGRVFELNTFDKIVWEYIFPVNQNGASGIQGSQPKFNYLFKVQKYSPNLPIFSSVHIEPINPIELLPIINDCYLGSDEQTNTAIPSPLINMNITSSFLMIENISNYIIDYKLINSSGSVVISSSLPLGKNQIDLKKMASGFYTFLFELDANDIHVERIIIP